MKGKRPPFEPSVMRASQKGTPGYMKLIIARKACSQSPPCHGEISIKAEDKKARFAEWPSTLARATY